MIGGSLVVLAFFIILWRGIAIALRAPDPLGCYLAAGITAMIVCQAMINLGVVLATVADKRDTAAVRQLRRNSNCYVALGSIWSFVEC